MKTKYHTIKSNGDTQAIYLSAGKVENFSQYSNVILIKNQHDRAHKLKVKFFLDSEFGINYLTNKK